MYTSYMAMRSGYAHTLNFLFYNPAARGPPLGEISYALAEINFEITRNQKPAEIRNHLLSLNYSVKSRKLLHTSLS